MKFNGKTMLVSAQFTDTNAVLFEEQQLTPEQQAQARENIGAAVYYHTTREEIGKAHDEINSAYIFSLYDALMEEYPDRVQKVAHTNNDGTFTNYEYVISTGDYSTEGAYVQAYGDNPHIKKPKYLLLNSIHGTERKTTFSTYRFIRDVLSCHNVPPAFAEGVILSVMPVGTPSAFDAFTRQSGNAVDINRNFDINWTASTRKDDEGNTFTYGEFAASEKETQAITKWLTANSDAELFIDCHNNGALNEKVLILGLPDNSISNTARKVALRGVDRIIPFWRDVIGYPDKVEALGLTEDGTGTEVKEREVIFSYSASPEIGGLAFGYAQEVLGICSLAVELVSHYGSHTEWSADMTADSPEAVAMGAEALGNILIEFYAQSCEVMMMSNIDNKLDAIAQQVNSGFRIESGTIVLEEDMLPQNGESFLQFRIPCSNGAKMATFCADDETFENIKSSSGVHYTGSIFGNCFEPGVRNGSGFIRSYMTNMQNLVYEGVDYGWVINDASTSVENTDGFKANVYALKAGTYHWTAYYWND